MKRSLVLLVVMLTACETEAPRPVRSDAEAEPSVVAKGPPLAKNDPRFKPYVPKPKAPVDYSKIDVGEEPMKGAAASLDALGEALVEALEQKDAEALAALAIAQTEYTQRFFPVTVNHRSGFGMGADLAWAELHGESRGDLQTALNRFGGQSLSFVRMEVESSETRGQVVLHRRPTLVVTDDSGAERELVMIGSVLEHRPSGGFKVLAYRDTR